MPAPPPNPKWPGQATDGLGTNEVFEGQYWGQYPNKQGNSGNGLPDAFSLDWWSQRQLRANFLLNKNSIQVDTPKRFDYSTVIPTLFGGDLPRVVPGYSGTVYYLEGAGGSFLYDQPGLNFGIGNQLAKFSGLLVDSGAGTVTTFSADTGSEIVPTPSNQVDQLEYPSSTSLVNALKVTIGSSGTGATPVTFTLFKNGGPTAITCTVIAGQPAYTKASDLAHTAIFDGTTDTWDVRVTANAPMGKNVAFSATIEGFPTGTGPNSGTLIANPKANGWYVARQFMVVKNLNGGQAVPLGLTDNNGGVAQIEITFPDTVQMKLRLNAPGFAGPTFTSLGPNGQLGGPLCPFSIPVTLEMYFDVETGDLVVGLQDVELARVHGLDGGLDPMPMNALQPFASSTNFNVQLYSFGGFAMVRAPGDNW